MSKPLKSFITFSRSEKMGLVVLAGVLLILLLVRVTMHFFIYPDINETQQEHLRQQWAQFKEAHPDTLVAQPGYVDRNDDGAIPIPEYINVNTADSATLVRLKGIGPVTAHKIMEYRSVHPFADFEEFRKLCRLSAANTGLLKPHIIVR